jgi:hypothetical protein
MEVVLKLLLVLSGVVACWLGFAWLGKRLGGKERW